MSADEHKLTHAWSGWRCACGWSSGPQETYNEADRLAATHMKEANHDK